MKTNPAPPAPSLEEGDGVSTPYHPEQEGWEAPAGGPAGGRPSDGLWWAAGTLLARWRFLLVVTVLAAGGSAVVSVLIPPEYQAETRVLLPQSGNSSMLGMLDRVAPGASALLGEDSGEYTRYLSILTSRTVLDRVVERFRLEEVYETTSGVDPRGDAIAKLLKHTGFEVALDFDYLAVRVLDRQPPRAAAIANYFVEQLNEENTRLTSTSAREERVFVERRMHEAEAALDSAQGQMQAFQERNGVLNFEQQGEAFYSTLAELRGESARLEVEYGALRRQYGDENPQVQAAAAAVAEAQAQEARILGGGDAMLPVPTAALPGVGRRYAQLYQEVVTQGKILEFVRPLYEQARFEERRQASAVQVLDPATVPVRKAKPQRALIVLGLTFSALLLAALYALARAWLRANAAWLSGRLRQAAG